MVSIYLLIKSADLIEESFVYISKKLQISEFFVGFVMLATISSLPELAIAINSADSAPELSVGNLLGATLIMLTLILGLAAMKFENLNFKGRFRRTEMTIGVCVMLLSVFFLADGKFEVYEGVILILSYLLLFIDVKKQFENKKVEEQNQTVPAKKVYILLTKSLAGIILLLFASNLAVDGVIALGEQIEIDNAIIGLFVLAIGTNTPELALLLRSKDFSGTKLAIGNFIGSAIFNSMTLGILAILSGGFEIEEFDKLIPVMVLIVFSSFLFLYFAFTGKEITKKEGAILVGCYLSLLVTEGIILLG